MQGTVDRRFERVRQVFEQVLDLGAAVSVIAGGKTVVDLWGGFADRARTRPWEKDTIVNVYSVTKGLTAICARRLVLAGQLDLDAPACRYFTELGKPEITVRSLLDHRAGLPALRELVPDDALYDWDRMVSLLAREEPWWPPGTAHGYHAVTFGWLVGEVLRRASGKTVGALVRELGEDAHVGLSASEDARVAEMRGAPRPPPGERSLLTEIMADPQSMLARTFANPPVLGSTSTLLTRAWRGAEIPSVNGHANARAIAAIYAKMPAKEIETAGRGKDLVLGELTSFGEGFMLPVPGLPLPAGAFGHPGAGGSIGFADPGAKLAFGFVCNQMGHHILLDPRARALIEATYECL
jgi:CubicO group peptidase (beta-lactamase class C family)